MRWTAWSPTRLVIQAAASHDMSVLKFVAHSRLVLTIAIRRGWLPAARYTNLRDVRWCDRLGFLDIEWRSYSFRAHLTAVRSTRPLVTVARDVECSHQLPMVLDQAEELAQYADYVVVVPKDPSLARCLREVIPKRFLLGYSVPTRYGATSLQPAAFSGRRVPLLGGRPDAQRRLADLLNVVSIDCNRFTLDARYGDYFDGEGFRPHPRGGYRRCLADSVRNIDKLWRCYTVASPLGLPSAQDCRRGT